MLNQDQIFGQVRIWINLVVPGFWGKGQREKCYYCWLYVSSSGDWEYRVGHVEGPMQGFGSVRSCSFVWKVRVSSFRAHFLCHFLIWLQWFGAVAICCQCSQSPLTIEWHQREVEKRNQTLGTYWKTVGEKGGDTRNFGPWFFNILAYSFSTSHTMVVTEAIAVQQPEILFVWTWNMLVVDTVVVPRSMANEYHSVY
jgi:hypothetical protein